jgi:hypothetical protein
VSCQDLTGYTGDGTGTDKGSTFDPGVSGGGNPGGNGPPLSGSGAPLSINLIDEKITGLEPNTNYTVNGTPVRTNAFGEINLKVDYDGTRVFDEVEELTTGWFNTPKAEYTGPRTINNGSGWFGTEVSIVKAGDSAAQVIRIPERPAAPEVSDGGGYILIADPDDPDLVESLEYHQTRHINNPDFKVWTSVAMEEQE